MRQYVAEILCNKSGPVNGNPAAQPLPEQRFRLAQPCYDKEGAETSREGFLGAKTVSRRGCTPGQLCSSLAGCGFVVSARLCKKRSVVMNTPVVAFALARPCLRPPGERGRSSLRRNRISKTSLQMCPAWALAGVRDALDNGAHRELPSNLSRDGRLQMQLVERHLVRKDQPEYASIDVAAFASKNLYNQANYQIRQAFIHEGTYLPYAEIYHRLKQLDCYKALPAKVANSILILLHKNWIAFFAALAAYTADPSHFTGRPKLPKYKDKVKGRNLLIYDTQALLKRAFKQTGKLVPSGLPIQIETCITEWRQVAQVRIVPRLDRKSV